MDDIIFLEFLAVEINFFEMDTKKTAAKFSKSFFLGRHWFHKVFLRVVHRKLLSLLENRHQGDFYRQERGDNVASSWQIKSTREHKIIVFGEKGMMCNQQKKSTRFATINLLQKNMARQIKLTMEENYCASQKKGKVGPGKKLTQIHRMEFATIRREGFRSCFAKRMAFNGQTQKKISRITGTTSTTSVLVGLVLVLVRAALGLGGGTGNQNFFNRQDMCNKCKAVERTPVWAFGPSVPLSLSSEYKKGLTWLSDCVI